MSTAGVRAWMGTLALLLIPAAASAHTSLKRSDPAKGARLAIAPTRIALWFTARPQLPFSRVTLEGPSGEIRLGSLVADSGNAFHAPIDGTLPPGDYVVRWQTASADGHPITGEFAFSVDGGAAAIRPAPPGVATTNVAPVTTARRHGPAPEGAHVEHEEYRSARWIEFVALLTVIGALGFRHGVLPPLAARGVPTTDAADRARRLGSSVLFLYALAIIARAYNESVAVHGVERALAPAEILPMLTATTWGIGWLAGAVGAALVAIGWALSRRRVVLGTPLSLTGALGMVFSPALSGHAASSARFVPSVMLDVVHVAAAGLWVGGLLIVLFAGIPAMRKLEGGNTDAAVSALVNSFHPLALFCAPLVIVAGIGTAYLRLNAVSDLWLTGYGLMLLRKTVFVVLVVALGAYNALRMRRRLGTPDATRRFRITGVIELLFVTGVLAFTTWLVTLPVPSEALVGGP